MLPNQVFLFQAFPNSSKGVEIKAQDATFKNTLLLPASFGKWALLLLHAIFDTW